MTTTEIEIRLARATDCPDVESCARAAFSKYIGRIGKEPAPMNADFATQIRQGLVRVVVADGQISGYIVFYPDGDHVHLESVAVLPDRSRQGIGSALISFAEATALKQGFGAVELHTNEAMTENLEMYPKMGYREVGRKAQDGLKRVFFRKSIS